MDKSIFIHEFMNFIDELLNFCISLCNILIQASSECEAGGGGVTNLAGYSKPVSDSHAVVKTQTLYADIAFFILKSTYADS